MFHQAPALLGQYRPRHSYLHRLDARAKIWPVLLILILTLLTDSFIFYAAITLLLIAALLGSKVGLVSLYRTFKPVIFLVVITYVYHLIFSGKDTETAFEIFGFAVTEGALYTGAFYTLRLVIFVLSAYLVTLTSSPSEFAEAIVKIFYPLRKIGLPINDFGLILFIALRFIPILYDEFTTIKNAQIIRGVDFSGSIVNRVRKTISLLMPMFIAAVSRAEELAAAIEARGYDGRKKRTFYSERKFGGSEVFFMVLSTLALFLLFWSTKKI